MLEKEQVEEVDYAYVLSLLKRFNLLVMSDIDLRGKFQCGDFSCWQFYQQKIFEDIIAFSEKGGAVLDSFSHEPSFWIRIRWPFFALFALTQSTISIFVSFVLRKKVFVFATDKVSPKCGSDFRMEKIYTYLKKNSISFIEGVHTLFRWSMVENTWKRRRFVFVLEAIDVLYFLKTILCRRRRKSDEFDGIDLTSFDERERLFVFKMLKRYLMRVQGTRFRVKTLERILKFIGIRKIVTIDSTRDYNELLVVARNLGIKTHAFQHGRFNQIVVALTSVGIPSELCVAPDNYVVWNEYWKEKLMNLSPAVARYSNIIVGGRVYGKKMIEVPKIIDDGIIGVLVPYEKRATKKQARKLVRSLLSCGNAMVIMKLRVDQSLSYQREHYGLEEFSDDRRLIVITSIEDNQWEKIDVVIGTYSTMLYDMIGAGRSVGILKSDSSQAEDLILDGLASWIDLSSPDFCRELSMLANVDEETIQKRKDRMAITADIDMTLDSIFCKRA